MKKYYTLVLFIFIISPLFAHAEGVVFEKTLYTYTQAGYPITWWARAFQGVTWLSNGTLVVTGDCKDDWGSGTFLFGSDGSYKGKADTCKDTSSLRLLCAEGGGCQMGTNVAERSDGSIVRLGQSRSFVRRSPVVYSLRSGNLSFLSRLFLSSSQDEYWTPQGPERDWEMWASYYSPVVVSGDILVVKKGGDGGYFPQLDRIVAFDLPSFDELWTEVPEGDLIGGIGDFVLTSHNDTNARPQTATLTVYRVTRSGMSEVDQETVSPGVVYNTPMGGVLNIEEDPSDTSVFAVSTHVSTVVNGVNHTTNKVIRYRKSGTGIQKIDERSFSAPVGVPYAILGDYVAFATGLNTAPRVWKGSQELVVENSPEGWQGFTSGVAFRKDGKLAVTTGSRVLLYQIGGVSAPPISILPPTGVGSGFNGLPPETTEKELTTVTKSILQQMGIGNCPLPPSSGATINTTGPAQLGVFLNCLLQTSLSGPYTSPPISSNTPISFQRHPIPVLTPSTPTQSSNNVSLTKTLLTMPGFSATPGSSDAALVGARWVDGKFVLSSFCSATGNKKGLWIFSESGAQVAERNACLDAGEGPNGSLDHMWGVVPNVQPVGNGQFIKEMGSNNNRPPLLYKVSDGSLVSKAWNARGDSGNGTDVTSDIAGIPGYAVVVENGNDNVLYGLPNWNVLQRISRKFLPITGVGNYIVGTPTPGNSDLVLYKVTNNALQLVNKITTNIRPVAAAVDPSSNGTRVGFLFINDGGTGKNHADIYTVDSAGLKFVKKVALPSTATFTSTGWQNAFALTGEYIAFNDCGLSALPAPNGTGDNASAAKCGLAVLKGTTRMTVQRLPNSTTGDGKEILPPAVRGIAISPNGTILVTNYYGAYLYKIGGSAVAN
jgi:hypothetical protein